MYVSIFIGALLFLAILFTIAGITMQKRNIVLAGIAGMVIFVLAFLTIGFSSLSM